MKKNDFHFQRDYRQDPIQRLRNTMMKIQEKQYDNMYKLRSSYSTGSLRLSHGIDQNQLRLSNLNKKKSLHMVKQTLDMLEEKVSNARDEIMSPVSMKKKTDVHINDISYEKEHEESERKQKLATDSSITLKTTEKKPNSLITSVPKPKNFKPFYINPYSPRRHNTYYLSQAVRAINEKNSLAVQHINASIRILKACEQYIGAQSLTQLESRRVNLPKNEFYKNKKTLVLDLDETLIHCVQNYQADVDFKTEFLHEGQKTPIAINIRRHAMTFLRKMAKRFQIIIFTASHHSYADTILDMLDSDNQIFQHRLYRQHCYVTENQLHVKDLRILNRKMSQIVLVDNAAYSYAFQLQNGIPILPYFQGNDYELVALQNYLQELDKYDDVRQINKKTFKLHHYTKFEHAEDLIEQLYVNNTL